MVALRPENTAGVVRALIERGSSQLFAKRAQPGAPASGADGNRYPDRFFYCGPMFRREHPQAGRMRQFQQFGVEMVNEKHPHADVEVWIYFCSLDSRLARAALCSLACCLVVLPHIGR